MSSEFGNKIKITVFGQSHGKAIGVTVDGLPAGEKIDEEELMRFMERRRPGKSSLATKRNEADVPKFISGVADGQTCGFPVCAIIENTDVRSKDYSELKNKPRPSHADYTAFIKWNGEADMRGGGHFSGRLTAPVCIAGGIAKQILERKGIFAGAHACEVAGIADDMFPLIPDKELFIEIAKKDIPVINDEKGALMAQKIAEAAKDGDSVGGIIECSLIGIPAGYGDPMFDGLENRLAKALFGIPAVKGVEFGAGFGAARMRGSQNNDPFIVKDGKILTKTNNSGGILGGITNGMPVVFRVAIKPTPSIAIPQKTVDLTTCEETELTIKGRHDPCIDLRAVSVVEAVAALVILDMIMEENKRWISKISEHKLTE